MDWLPPVVFVVALVVVGVIGQRMGWMDFRGKGKGRATAGNVLAPLDEVFAPTRHEARLELERQTELPAPAPAPGDGHKGIGPDGVVRIDLGELRDHDSRGDGRDGTRDDG